MAIEGIQGIPEIEEADVKLLHDCLDKLLNIINSILRLSPLYKELKNINSCLLKITLEKHLNPEDTHQKLLRYFFLAQTIDGASETKNARDSILFDGFNLENSITTLLETKITPNPNSKSRKFKNEHETITLKDLLEGNYPDIFFLHMTNNTHNLYDEYGCGRHLFETEIEGMFNHLGFNLNSVPKIDEHTSIEVFRFYFIFNMSSRFAFACERMMEHVNHCNALIKYALCQNIELKSRQAKVLPTEFQDIQAKRSNLEKNIEELLQEFPALKTMLNDNAKEAQFYKNIAINGAEAHDKLCELHERRAGISPLLNEIISESNEWDNRFNSLNENLLRDQSTDLNIMREILNNFRTNTSFLASKILEIQNCGTELLEMTKIEQEKQIASPRPPSPCPPPGKIDPSALKRDASFNSFKGFLSLSLLGAGSKNPSNTPSAANSHASSHQGSPRTLLSNQNSHASSQQDSPRLNHSQTLPTELATTPQPKTETLKEEEKRRGGSAIHRRPSNAGCPNKGDGRSRTGSVDSPKRNSRDIIPRNDSPQSSNNKMGGSIV